MEEQSFHSSSSNTMARRWARRVERACCNCVAYLPLAFVYSMTTWAVWVDVHVTSVASKTSWLGTGTSIVSVLLYLLTNWSYTTAIFTHPGSTTSLNGEYMSIEAPPHSSSFTVKSNGEMRFCKKCQARKPDRAHHCSSCRRCVLKMDHHCPWLATCVGLRNYKAFLLFLIYTTTFCWWSFAVSGSWVWTEIVNNTRYVETMMPVNYILLAVISGIIGLVVGAFTAWHIMLACRGQTTIECLEKTRYLSPLRNTLHTQFAARHDGPGGTSNARHGYGHQLLDMHANAIPGITRPEEGIELRDQTLDGQRPIRMDYNERERQRSRKQYDDYLDEEDSKKLPNAFDLGWRRNLKHLFGPSPWLWFFPICNTTGDGWSWEANPKWIEARERIRVEREQQRAREIQAGWGGEETPVFARSPAYAPPAPAEGPRVPTKADRVLGRDPNLYADNAPPGKLPSIKRHSVRGKTLEEQIADLDKDDSDEEIPPYEDQPKSTDQPKKPVLDLARTGSARWGPAGASALLRKPSPASSAPSTPSDFDDID